MLYKAEGIVLKSMDYGEGNKIITLFTREYGKVAIVAKGAKKIKSRFNVSTQVFSHGEYFYYLTKDLGTLNSVEIEQYFSDIYHDIPKTAYAAYIVELVDKLTESHVASSVLFDQLLASLEQINAGKDEEIIAKIFEMKIFMISGYKPELSLCSICGKDYDLSFFSIRHGGLICSDHKEEKTILLQSNTIKILRLFEKVDIRRLGNIDVKNTTKSQLNIVMELFYEEYIGIPLKSNNFIRQLKDFE